MRTPVLSRELLDKLQFAAMDATDARHALNSEVDGTPEFDSRPERREVAFRLAKIDDAIHALLLVEGRVR